MISSRTFNRLAVALPLVVPALVVVIVHRLGVDPGDGWIGKIAQILLASLLYGGIPYAGLALWAVWRIRRRSDADVGRFMLRAPLLMAALFAVVALVTGVIVGAPGPFAAVAALGAIASIVLGYVYVLVVLVVRRTLYRDAWIRRADLIADIDRHITKTVAPVDSVFHEIVSDDLHIDLHIVQSSADRPFHTIVTSGMSELPMITPQDSSEMQYAELCILLEPSWQLSQESFADEGWYWPLRLLKTLARYPTENATWLGYGHTIALSNPPEPFATNTTLCAALVIPPRTLGESFFTMKRPDGNTTHFWTVVPLYESELNFKMARDADELLDAFDRAGVDDVVRRDRPAAV